VLGEWSPLEHLKVGDRIAIPRRMPAPTSPTSWPRERLILLAHMIGDGCYATHQPLHYTTASEMNASAVEDAARESFDIVAKRVRQGNWWHLYLSAGANKWHPNPLRTWLRQLGIDGQRSIEKVIPQEIFSLDDEHVALFLRHLWATDGCIWRRRLDKGPLARIYYATSSRALALGVQRLLGRFGIVTRIKKTHKAIYAPSFHVHIVGTPGQLRFANAVGCFGDRGRVLESLIDSLNKTKPNTNRDTIPPEVWQMVRARMGTLGITQREMARLRGTTYGGTSHFRFAPSRSVLSSYAGVLNAPDLEALAESDVYWDEVASIEPVGEMDVYDMTVPGTHNFIADGIVVHNSIEQDSDMVMFIYRDEVYNPDSEARGEAELHLAKHRNGPTGMVRLAFMNQYTKFASIARGLG
jgi:replicative DNA helicase